MSCCPICCEPFNGRRKPVACQFCEHVACGACVRAYLLSRPEAAQCMGCRAVWDDEALERVLPKSFRDGEYKEHVAKVLVEREKARLPEAQEYARAELEARAHEAIVKRMHAERAANVSMIYSSEFNAWYETVRYHNRMAAQARARPWAGEPPMTAAARAIKPRFIHRCPANDCRGFLDEEFKCGLCAVTCCKHCMEALALAEGGAQAGHVCNPDAIETVKEMAKTTRTCPTCAAPIFKTEGCDQMYCTACHTAFSWNTGAIETGRIHNPHYYEWQRRNGGVAMREPGDVVCGGLPRYAYFQHPEMAIAYPALMHIEILQLPMARAQPSNNLDLRIKYLLGEVDDVGLKRTVMRRDKKARKRRAEAQVLEMLTTAAGDVLRTHGDVAPEQRAESEERILDQLRKLRDFANEALGNISRRYGCVVPQFDGWTQNVVRVK